MSFSCSSVFFLVILSTNHLFLVKMRNFPKKYLVVRKLYVNLHRKVRMGVCGRYKLTSMEETSGQLYGQSRKDVFNTLPVWITESSKFESKYSGSATEASAWEDVIFPHVLVPYIY